MKHAGPQDRYVRRARPALKLNAWAPTISGTLATVDGDTLDLDVDLGYRVSRNDRFRLLGIDTPELNSSNPNERGDAVDAALFVEAWLDTAIAQADDERWPLTIRSRLPRGRRRTVTGKWGRPLIRVWSIDGSELGRDLLDQGLARIYLP